MELSIIVPIYRNNKELKNFLKKISEQNSCDFELIFIIDTNLDGPLELIQNYIQKIKNKINIIFNSKRIGRINAINAGLAEASGEFSLIVSTSNIFEINCVSEIKKLIKEKPADIIEFRGSMKEPIKLNGEMRAPIQGVVNIEERPSIIAYTYPFDFNKIWKTRIIKEVSQNHSNIMVNSRFSIEHVYKAFAIAKTYSNSSKKIVVSKSYITRDFNPLKLFKQWDVLQKHLSSVYSNKYAEEMLYAEFMHKSILLSAFIGASKNKVLIDKASKIYNKNLNGKFQNFLNNNKYGTLRSNEAKLIRENGQMSTLAKSYKEIW